MAGYRHDDWNQIVGALVEVRKEGTRFGLKRGSSEG
jgi:hypothetical protein